MRKVELEELESRLVPSSIDLRFHSAFLQACAPGGPQEQVVLRWALAGAGPGYADLAGRVGQAGSSAATGSPGNLSPQVSADPDPDAAPSSLSAATAAWVRGEFPPASPDPPEPAGSNPLPVAPLTQTVAVSPGQPPSRPSPAPLEVHLAVLLCPAPGPARGVCGPPAGVGGAERAVGRAPVPWLVTSHLPVAKPGTCPQGGASSGEPAGQGPDLPTLPPGDVLTTLPPVDLSVLEIALKQFLAGLGQTESCQPWDDTGAGWYSWVVAGVAAAVAGEVARRRLRQTSLAPAWQFDGIPGAPHDPSPTE
jgi:hypothetical protein